MDGERERRERREREGGVESERDSFIVYRCSFINGEKLNVLMWFKYLSHSYRWR